MNSNSKTFQNKYYKNFDETLIVSVPPKVIWNKLKKQPNIIKKRKTYT